METKERVCHGLMAHPFFCFLYFILREMTHDETVTEILYNLRCNCDGLRIDLDMAAAGVAILDDPYLGGDALAHRVGMTDDAHLLALRTLQHGEGVDDGGEGIRVESSEAFIDEQILEGDVAGG